MAIDFVHTAQIVEAIIDVLVGADGDTHTGGLPAAWFTIGDKEELRLLEHGDYSDYAVSGKALEDDLPAILVRGLGPEPTDRAGTSGMLETDELVRVVHIRHFEQCYDGSGDRELNMTRSRARYAKIVGDALFNDPNKQLATIAAAGTRSEVSLTCADTNGAQVINMLFDSWDLGHQVGNPNSTEDVALLRESGLPIWAIACDIRARIRTG